jgi:hypothetical protein
MANFDKGKRVSWPGEPNHDDLSERETDMKLKIQVATIAAFFALYADGALSDDDLYSLLACIIHEHFA